MSATPRVLVVEDSRTQAALFRAQLQKAGFEVQLAYDGAEALAAVREAVPDIIVTDLQMPGMNGLELVEAVKADHPALPIVLMTGVGSEEIAAEALKRGAASYVPKRNIQTDLTWTLHRIVSMTMAARRSRRLGERLTAMESHYELSNDEDLVPALITRIQEDLEMLGVCDEGERLQVGMALDEALVNAIHHGNLEAPSSLRDEENGAAYARLVRQRLCEPPYCERKVHIAFKASRGQAEFVIRDEGPGFDPTSVPDPTAPENLEKVSGRGLLLINTFMDHVRHNAEGNEITMIKTNQRAAAS